MDCGFDTEQGHGLRSMWLAWDYLLSHFQSSHCLTDSAHVDVVQVVARIEDCPQHVKPSGSPFCKISACTLKGYMLTLELFLRQMEGKVSGVLARFRENFLGNQYSMSY